MRERLACLTRKCRHAAHRLETIEAGMYLIGGTYNFCFPHHELSTAKHQGHACTPAMAAGLTDHIWSVSEMLQYKVALARFQCNPNECDDVEKHLAVIRHSQNDREGVLANILYQIQLCPNAHEDALLRSLEPVHR